MLRILNNLKMSIQSYLLPYNTANETNNDFPEFLGQQRLYAPLSVSKVIIELMQITSFGYSTDFGIYGLLYGLSPETLNNATLVGGWFFTAAYFFK